MFDRALVLRLLPYISTGLTLLLIFAAFRAAPRGAHAVSAAVPQDAPMVALTFDDGPYKGCTPHVLDALEKHGARATFFVLGSRIEGREELLVRIAQSGCEIGSHGWSHADLTCLGARECALELSKTDEAIMAVTGAAPKVMRPPYGHYNSTVKKAASRPMALWTVDAEDWRPRDVAELTEYVLCNASDGDIILMHDQQESTAAAIEGIVSGLVERGFLLVTVSELMAARDSSAMIQ